MKAGDIRTVVLLPLGATTSQVRFTVDRLPAFVAFQAGTLTIAPSVAEAGSFTFSVSVTDGTQTAMASFTLTVTPVPLTCGAGTVQVGNQCVVAPAPVDPLIGIWISTASNYAGYRCSFARDSAWSCFWHDGWPSSWSKLGDNHYYFGISNGPSCSGRSSFSSDGTHLSLVLAGEYAGQPFCDGVTAFTFTREP